MSTLEGNQPVKLTKTVVDNARPPDGKDQHFIRDSQLQGFALRITRNGTKAFIVEKRIKGRVRRITLGKYGILTVEQARREAQKQLAQIAMGSDPIAERHSQRVKGTTLAAAFGDFLAARKNLKTKTVHDYRYCIEHYLDRWLNKPLTEITSQMISRRHREIGTQNGKHQANLVFRTLKSVLNFAKYEYLDGNNRPILQDNPVDILSHTRAWYPTRRRQTLIKAYQLAPWYAAVQDLKAPDKPTSCHVIADFLIFVLFTGLRSKEATTLRWAQVDFRDRTLFLPDPKNREPFTLPLSEFVCERLRERQALRINDYVFPDRSGHKHLIEPRRQMRQVTAATGIEFSVHDLRRTFITVAESLDIPHYSLKRLVNHKVGDDVTAGYIITDVERLRGPMEQVSTYLEQQIRTDKVIPFRRAR